MPWIPRLSAQLMKTPRTLATELPTRSTKLPKRKVVVDSRARWLRRRLLAWGAINFRDFPWRHDRDPFRTLITEILLRQTNASRVVPVREKFLTRFSNADQLAHADPRIVRESVAPLGFGYQRAPQLIALSAELKVRNSVPRSVEALGQLPGVGTYTARAVACFA